MSEFATFDVEPWDASIPAEFPTRAFSITHGWQTKECLKRCASYVIGKMGMKLNGETPTKTTTTFKLFLSSCRKCTIKWAQCYNQKGFVMWKWLIWLIFFIEWDEDWMGGRWDLSSALPLLVPLSRLAYKQFHMWGWSWCYNIILFPPVWLEDWWSNLLGSYHGPKCSKELRGAASCWLFCLNFPFDRNFICIQGDGEVMFVWSDASLSLQLINFTLLPWLFPETHSGARPISIQGNKVFCEGMIIGYLRRGLSKSLMFSSQCA